MEDYQAEILAIYAEMSYALASRVTFAVNQLTEEYAKKEIKELHLIKKMITEED